MKKNQLKFAKELLSLFGNAAQYFVFSSNSLVFNVKKQNLSLVMLVLKKHQNLLFCSLIDLCAIDFLFKRKRFSLVYNLISIFYNQRVFVKTQTNFNEKVKTLTSVFKSANWLEREAFDMFGIYFENHVDLRRILTDYGFEGNPLRKDFPLSGFTELYYDTSAKKILCKPVQFAQNFRFFSFNHWANLLNKTNIKN